MAAGTRTFVMKFVGDVKGLIGDLNKVDDQLGKMSGKGKMALGAGLAAGSAIGAGAVAGFGKAIALAADYEKAIDAVGAVAGASAADQKRLYDVGRRIGKETSFTATQAAAAMEELAAQGLTVEQIINGAADATVALAAAGGVDLPTAATAAAQTMGVWKLQSKDMTDVVNRMAGAAAASKFDVTDMTLALSQGAGVAAAAGVSYQDFLTTIAATANSFQSGSDAGTGFKTFVQRLVPQGKAATKAMRELGLITKDGQNTFFDARGDFLGMANAAEVLQKALAPLSDEERTEALKNVFGSDASRTAAALAEQGRAGFLAVDQKMADTDATEIAAQRLDNLRGELDKLKGSLEDIGIGLGERFLPPLAKAAGFLAEWLPKIPTPVFLAVGAFMALIGAASGLALVFLPLAGVAGALGLSIGAVTLAFLGIPIAIGAVIASGYLLFTHWDELTAKAAGVRDAILGAVGLEGNSKATSGMNALGKGLGNAIPGFGPVFGGVAALKGMLGKGKSAGLGDDINGYASGGVVPGPRGSAQLAMVHGGETILPTHKGGFGNITINVAGSVHSDASLQRAILDALTSARQRGSLGLT